MKKDHVPLKRQHQFEWMSAFECQTCKSVISDVKHVHFLFDRVEQNTKQGKAKYIECQKIH